jgi:hypothetical protein
MTTKPRLTWSRQPDETGLARVRQSPRGAVLKANGKEAAYVSPHLGGRNWREVIGWYFVGMGRNSFNDPDRAGVYPTIDEAKAACKAWIVAQIAKEPTP